MNVILDTGPWVALIDRSESRHTDCVSWLKIFRGHLYSTEAVLTEVMYLLNFSADAQSAALDFIIKSVVEIIPCDIESTKKACRKFDKVGSGILMGQKNGKDYRIKRYRQNTCFFNSEMHNP